MQVTHGELMLTLNQVLILKIIVVGKSLLLVNKIRVTLVQVILL